MKSFTVGLGLCLLFAPAAFAGPVVYDNGGPIQQWGNEMTQWIQAEDFVLARNTLITDVHFWTIELPGGGYAGSIWSAIYADAGGEPNLGAPAVMGFAPGLNLTRAFTGNSSILGVYDEYEYSFDIAPFTAMAGVKYWLGLHNGDLANTARAEFYWETTNLNGTSTGHEDILLPAGDGWFDNLNEHAFQLTSTVPEPATMALFGVGLVGLALLRRRRA